MPRFYVSPSSISTQSGIITITGDDAKHISKSLRMVSGEGLVVCDMHRNEYDCRILTLSPNAVELQITGVKISNNEPSVRVTLFQALVKGSKMDTIIQKAVELGVSRIFPVLTDRVIAKRSDGEYYGKMSRWQKIADSAAGQCGRGEKVEVGGVISYSDALENIKSSENGFICYEGDETVGIKTFLSGKQYSEAAFLIGPEGGLSVREVDCARNAGIPLVGLGKLILRAETASGFVLTAIMLDTENL